MLQYFTPLTLKSMFEDLTEAYDDEQDLGARHELLQEIRRIQKFYKDNTGEELRDNTYWCQSLGRQVTIPS